MKRRGRIHDGCALFFCVWGSIYGLDKPCAAATGHAATRSSGSSDHRNASMYSARAQQRFLFPLFFMLLFLPDQWFYNIYHPMLHGCFWHRCPHCKPSMPKSNVEYWVVKFERNVERDERSRAALEELGWTVHVIWECQLKKKAIDDTFAALLPALAEELGKELKGI